MSLSKKTGARSAMVVSGPFLPPPSTGEEGSWNRKDAIHGLSNCPNVSSLWNYWHLLDLHGLWRIFFLLQAFNLSLVEFQPWCLVLRLWQQPLKVDCPGYLRDHLALLDKKTGSWLLNQRVFEEGNTSSSIHGGKLLLLMQSLERLWRLHWFLQAHVGSILVHFILLQLPSTKE